MTETPALAPLRLGGIGAERRVGRLIAGLGVVLGGVAVAFDRRDAWAAAAQDWSPFVLVAGLLLVGLVADGDGLFGAAGRLIGRTIRSGRLLFVAAALLTGLVTAVLNLDTSVAFLTPVFVHTARSRGERGTALVIGVLLCSNAGSLFLPGSNLTNLIVLGQLHLTGGAFFAHMWLAGAAALVVTAVVVAGAERRCLDRRATVEAPADPVVWGVGAAAVAAATALMVLLPSPALPVAAVGAAAAAVRLGQRHHDAGAVVDLLGVPTLAGLFGIAVAMGTLGRAWTGPAALLAHLDGWGTAVVAALASVVLNNLPAASLLAARVPARPYALLVGLDLGPNLFVTGSLSWILWLRAARSAGGEPSIGRAARVGLVAVPCSIAAALGVLALTGVR